MLLKREVDEEDDELGGGDEDELDAYADEEPDCSSPMVRPLELRFQEQQRHGQPMDDADACSPSKRRRRGRWPGDDLKRASGAAADVALAPPPASFSAVGGAQSSLKLLKAVLPPISQEQFDAYSFLDTDELVASVRDLLGQHSISQRLFGEAVLGLSQGSVSDLLVSGFWAHGCSFP